MVKTRDPYARHTTPTALVRFVEYLLGEYLTKPPAARGTILERTSGAEWVVPNEGVLSIEARDDRLHPNDRRRRRRRILLL